MRSFKAGQTFNYNIHSTIKEYKDADSEDIGVFTFYAKEQLEQYLEEIDDNLEGFALINAFNAVIECWKEGRYKFSWDKEQ